MPWRTNDLDMRSLVADRTADRLIKGDPVLGWAGDPYLVLTWNRVEEAWEVFRDVPGDVRLVARKRGHLDADELIRELVRRDTQGRGHEDQVSQIISNNEMVQRTAQKRAEDARIEAAQHFKFAAEKDGLL